MASPGLTVRPPVVLVTGADLMSGIGGHTNYVRAHARAAQRAGFDPHIFCYGARGGVIETDFGTVHRMPLRSGLDPMPGFRHRRHHTVWRLPMLARAVAAFVRRPDGPRLIHSFSVYGWVGVTAARRLAEDGVKVATVVSAYDTLVRESEARLKGVGAAHPRLRRLAFVAELWWAKLVADRFERRGYAEARVLLVNYDSVQRMLAERYGVGAKIRKVSYASESAFLRPGGTGRALSPGGPDGAPRSPTIVSVSRHDPRKGVDVLIAALVRLREDNVDFRAVLVGAGPLLAAHRRRVDQVGLGDRVTLTGFVPDPFPYLEDADVYVLPSLEEGSGSVALLEALHVGAAVIASRVDGIPEDIAHEETGLLVDPGHAEGLAFALRRLLSDGELRRRLARGGHATFQRRFSAATLADTLRDVYGKLGVTPSG